MIPESVRRTRECLRLSTKKMVLKESLTSAEEAQLAKFYAENKRDSKHAERRTRRLIEEMHRHRERARGLNGGTYGATAA
jgi:hypothetical protein